MDTAFFTALILSLSAGGPPIPAGSGALFQIVGDPSAVTWFIEGGISSGSPSVAVSAPDRCTATCAFDFTRTTSGLPVWASATHLIVPTFTFRGPTVSATARCTLCEGPRGAWVTDWARTPVTFTGVLRIFALADMTQVSEVVLVGSGEGYASNHFYNDPGPWNYSTVGYDVTYTVAPEPAGLGVIAAGAGLVLVRVVRRRVRLSSR